MLCPDGSAEVSGEFNVRKLARAGAEAVQEAIAAEREACAAVCDSFRNVLSDEEPYHRGIAVGSTSTAAMIADLIRARVAESEMQSRTAPANQNLAPQGRRGDIAAAAVPNTWWP
jgi:hypothetical protein